MFVLDCLKHRKCKVCGIGLNPINCVVVKKENEQFVATVLRSAKALMNTSTDQCVKCKITFYFFFIFLQDNNK